MITFTIAPDQEAVVTSTFGKIVTTSTDPSTSTFLGNGLHYVVYTLLVEIAPSLKRKLCGLNPGSANEMCTVL